MKVLVVEDEINAAEHLCHLINELDASITIVKRLDTVRATVQFFEELTNTQTPDLVFMDIQLSDGSSFEVFKQIQVPYPIVFTTAYDEYALQAFEVHSLDYLLKPIDKPALARALEKYRFFASGQPSANADTGIQGLPPQAFEKLVKQLVEPYKKRFIVKYGETILFKNADEVACFYAEDKTVYLLSRQDGRRYIVDHTLEELESSLLDPEHHFRINRKFIVNIQAITQVKSYYNSRLKVQLDAPVEHDMIVSRDRVASFKEWLNQ